MAYQFWKKKWEREPCTFELQEYGGAGKPGWATVSNPSGEIPKKDECAELFKPGCHYRVMAKSVTSGKLIGAVWKHYEPLPGGVQAKQVEQKAPAQPREPREPRSASDWMKQYAGEIAETLGPLAELLEALRGIDFFGGGQTQAPSGNPQFPPLEFSGRAPWVMHPYIVREIGAQIQEVSDHIMDRLSGLPAEAAKKMEAQAKAGKEEKAEEEEEVLLPNAEEYITPPPTEEPGEPEEPEEPETVPTLTPNEKPKEKRRRKKE